MPRIHLPTEPDPQRSDAALAESGFDGGGTRAFAPPPMQLFAPPVQREALDDEEEETMQMKAAPVQREALGEKGEEPVQGIRRAIDEGKQGEPMQYKTGPVEREEAPPQPNNTGLPDDLKVGIEQLGGYSMDDVKVHYNSDKPAQLHAHAYAQGTDIHIGPGQEKHLPHEAWHVVQQKQGRVKPTLQMEGAVEVNDDEGLEREADVMSSCAIIYGRRSGKTVNGKTAKTEGGKGEGVEKTRGEIKGRTRQYKPINDDKTLRKLTDRGKFDWTDPVKKTAISVTDRALNTPNSITSPIAQNAHLLHTIPYETIRTYLITIAGTVKHIEEYNILVNFASEACDKYVERYKAQMEKLMDTTIGTYPAEKVTPYPFGVMAKEVNMNKYEHDRIKKVDDATVGMSNLSLKEKHELVTNETDKLYAELEEMSTTIKGTTVNAINLLEKLSAMVTDESTSPKDVEPVLQECARLWYRLPVNCHNYGGKKDNIKVNDRFHPGVESGNLTPTSSAAINSFPASDLEAYVREDSSGVKYVTTKYGELEIDDLNEEAAQDLFRKSKAVKPKEVILEKWNKKSKMFEEEKKE